VTHPFPCGNSNYPKEANENLFKTKKKHNPKRNVSSIKRCNQPEQKGSRHVDFYGIGKNKDKRW
jgi:hypothetical protein